MGRKLLLLGLALGTIMAAPHTASAQAYGSYVESCTQIAQRGPILSAFCRDVYGRFLRSSLDLRACSGGDVANRNGRLICDGRPPRRFGPGRGFRDYDGDFAQPYPHPSRRYYDMPY